MRHPIDVLATDHEKWQGWNSWRSVKEDFNRELIFSVAQDKHDPTLWLFAGSGRCWNAGRSRTRAPPPWCCVRA